jgi:hypothetical protein
MFMKFLAKSALGHRRVLSPGPTELHRTVGLAGAVVAHLPVLRLE